MTTSRVALAVAATVAGTLSLRAATYDWAQMGPGTFAWNNANGELNWVTPGFPNAVGDVANITSDLFENQFIDLNTEITVGILNVGDFLTSNQFTLQPGLSGSLVFNNGAAPAQLNQTATSVGDVIIAPITTVGDLNISNAAVGSLIMNGLVASGATSGTQTVTVSGNVRMAGEIGDGIAGGKIGIVKDGEGTLTLVGNNSFSGGVTINAGTVDVGSANAFGATNNVVQINAGATLANSSFIPVTLTNQYTQLWTGDFSFAGPCDLNLGTGVVAMTGTRNITVTAGTLEVAGIIAESGGTAGITKLGTGSLALSGANIFNGPVTVSGGMLIARNNGALGNNTAVSVAAGATLTLDGGVTIAGKTLSIAGEGVATQQGALRGVNGDNVWVGDINVNTSAITRVVAGSGTLTINGNMITSGTAANGLVFQGSGTVNGVISGDANITRSNNDPGVWTFNGANTHTGNTLVSNGALQIGNALALQFSPLTVNSAVNGLRFSPGINAVSLLSLTGTVAAANFSLNDTAGAPVALTVGTNGLNSTYAGAINGTGTLVKVGAGTLTLSGASQFSGGVTINSGALTASDATAVVAGATNVRNGLGTGLVSMATGTTLNLRATGTSDSSQQRLVYGNDLAYSGPVTITVDRGGGTGSNKILVMGNLTLGADPLTVTSANNYAVQFGNTTLTANATVNSGTATGNVILGNVTENGGAFSLTKTGAGRMTIVGNAAHTGGTIVSAGVLQVGLGGTTGSVAGNIANDANVTFLRSDSTTYAGQISGTGGLTKSGTGTLTLTGANTYSGITNVTNGTLLLDFSAATTVLNALSPVTLGGTLIVKGATTGTTAQTLGNFTGAAALPSKIVVDNNGGAGTTLTLGNTWTMNAGNTIHVDLTKGGAVQSSPTLGGGVIIGNGAVARVAVTAADGHAYFGTVAGGLIAPQTTLTALTSTSSSTTTNFNVSGDVVSAGAVQTNTLRIDTSAGPGSLDLNGALSFTRTALLMDGASDFEIKTTSGTGSVANTVIHQYGTGALIYSAPIAAGGAFTKGGPGLLVGNMQVATSGSPTVLDGVYRMATTFANPTGSLTLADGILELGSADYTASFGTNAGQIRILSDGGFSAFGGTRVVNLGGVGANVVWDQTNFLPGNAVFQLSSKYSDSTVDFRNGILLGSTTRTLNVNNGTADVDAILSGVVAGSADFIKTGPGTLSLSAANTLTGVTRVKEGVIQVNGSLSGAAQVISGVLQGSGDGFTAGIISGPITVGDGTGTADAVLSAGNGVGKLNTFSMLNFASDGVFRFDLNSELLLSDEMSANGVSIASGAVFQGFELGSPIHLLDGTPFIALQNTSFDPITDTFANLPEGGFVTIGMTTFQATYTGGDGNDLQLTAAVPEPGSIALLLLGVPMIVARRRRA